MDIQKLLFISEFDANDPISRSGVPFRLFEAAKHLGLKVSALQVNELRTIPEKLLSRYRQFLHTTILRGKKGWYDAMFSVTYSKGFGRSLTQLKHKSDLWVLSISPRAVAFLPPGPPLALWIDNTFDTYAMYPGREGICRQTFNEANRVERMAFARAERVYTASGWLAQRLPETHGLSPHKISVLPRGANLADWPTESIVDKAIVKRMNDTTCRLLFVNSGNWMVGRKGGPLVLDTWRILKNWIPAQLTIVGDIPMDLKEKLEAEGAICTGKINRAGQEGEARYVGLLLQSHFMFVPSRADGFGIVYAEAAACGLPSLAKAIMGVTEAVKKGITGHLLGAEATANDFASLLKSLWEQKEAYKSLCRSTYTYAQEHFSWENNVKKIVEDMKNLKSV
jgi:glycosyltransferase involved in cell wall biosynthesis